MMVDVITRFITALQQARLTSHRPLSKGLLPWRDRVGDMAVSFFKEGSNRHDTV